MDGGSNLGQVGCLCKLGAGEGPAPSLLSGFNVHDPGSQGGKKHCGVRLWVLSMQGRAICAGESSGGVKQLGSSP